MKNLKPIVLGCILTISCLAIVFLAIQYRYKRQDVNLTDLDMSQTRLPDRLTCTWYSSDLSWNYQVVTSREWYRIYVADPDVNIKAFQWDDEKEGSVVHLAVVDYSYPIIANLNYFLLDPARRERESNSNFSSKSPDSIPESWEWKNEAADKESVQCGGGIEEKCYGWYYRATYGQYYLYIYYHGPDCFEDFEMIVKSINEEFAKDLR